MSRACSSRSDRLGFAALGSSGVGVRAALGLLLAASAACGAAEEVEGTGNRPGLLDGGGSPAADAGSNEGGVVAVPRTDGGPTPITDGCGGERYEARTRQLDIYMMVDESGSMIPWWPFVVPAINGFWTSPAAAGIGVGMQLFGKSCNVADYATPRVPIAPLPANAAALGQALPILPTSGTATRPAMEGAIQHAKSWAMSHPDSKVVVLLVTDGLPDECNSTVENVAQVAKAGFEGTPSIPTYVIGLPLLDPLNPIAVAGGTQKALAADPSNSQALIDAMNAVRGLALPCDYALPDNTQDRALVNLDYQPVSGAVQRIPRVADAAACSTAGQGWYYASGDAKRLVACDATCSTLKSGGGQVNVVLGCPTVTLF